MKPIWFILWAAAIWQIASWTFAPPPKPAPATASRNVPLDRVEQGLVEARGMQRRGALAALDMPWSGRCSQDRTKFLSGLNEYYYHRQNQTRSYSETYGQAGADYIAGQWSTADDSRIDRLTQEAYARGYLKPSDFDGVASKTVSTVVKNERVTGNGCSA
jgi:hypothetical protein